ncbi:MAG: hypothetical protein ABS98_00585 [Lysobacteraceae bacterium SCN 69-48]|nr:MAG: hypothetical protein ABS98_00585 [Xanthomonadaceae bacterium SCN 69-48]
MAKKISRKEATASAQQRAAADAAAEAAAQAAAELDILHPERRIRLRGRLLTLREYGYIEGLNLQPGIRGLLEALYGLFDRASAPPSAAQVRDVFTADAVTLQWLMAQAFTPYPEDTEQLQAFTEQVAENCRFVATLDDIEGDALMAAWWGANAGFFIRRFRERRLAEANRSAPSGSTQP